MRPGSENDINSKPFKQLPIEQYRQLSRELVYDTFMLSRQESQPQQNVPQDPHQAALDALRQRERELVANLQHGSSTLASNTRGAYRIILSDYKAFS